MGGWVFTTLQLTNSPTRIFDISEIIPNDGNTYEAIIDLHVDSSNRVSVNLHNFSGSYMSLRPAGDIEYHNYNTFIFNPNDRTLAVSTTSSTANKVDVGIQKYRRVN